MEEECRIPSIPYSNIPLAPATNRAETKSTADEESAETYGTSQPRFLTYPQSASHDNPDTLSALDVQYVDLMFKLQSVLEQIRRLLAPDTSSKQSGVLSLLKVALVDLRVWAHDLCDDNVSFLEYLRDLSSENHSLKSHIQRIFGNIEHLLSEVNVGPDAPADFRSREQIETGLLSHFRGMNSLVDNLKALKPSLKTGMSSWKETNLTRVEYTPKDPPTVLTFDGGGVRSYSSLLILKTLIDIIREELARQRDVPLASVIRKPCEIFDFIFGSSSGGYNSHSRPLQDYTFTDVTRLIAIMLGRLEMSVEECIERFCSYADTVFARPHIRFTLLRSFSTPKYNAESVTQATRRLVGQYDPTPSQDKWRRNLFGSSHCRCKTGAFATVLPNATSYLFRTYDVEIPLGSGKTDLKPLNPGPASTHQIWEVARATSAAPTFFAPMRIDHTVFIDGGVTTNNPTQESLREVALLYGRLSGICLVSIGSGLSDEPLLSESELEGRGSSGFRSKNILRVLREVVTDTEQTNADVRFEANINSQFAYFRFNTTTERQIRLDDWDTSGRTRSEIELAAKKFLERQETKEELRRCASVIVAKMTKTNVHAGNVYYFLPRSPTSTFIGRDEHLHFMREKLTSSLEMSAGLPKVFVITGMGGQGKSELCLKFVQGMREEFWGIFWVDVSAPRLAESDFVAIAKALGAAVEKFQDAIRVLANLKKRWLLVLDNADDPETDYQRYIPPGQSGIVLITSRMMNLQQYSTIGAIHLDSLSRSELTELLLRLTGARQAPTASALKQAEDIISVLGSHTLAIIQAGAFIAAGHCRLDQYLDVFQNHRQRMLRYTPSQSISRYGNIYVTLEATSAALDKESYGTDASSLLDVLSRLNCSPVPIRVFEAAWRGLNRDWFQLQSPSYRPTEVIKWYTSESLSLLRTVQGTGASGPAWDFLRFSEARHLLETLALVTRKDDQLSMHPLVHAWANDRQSADHRVRSWLETGSLIVLAHQDPSFWHLHQWKLRAHLQYFLDVDLAAIFSSGPDEVIMEILLHCGHLLLQMRDDTTAIRLVDNLFRELKADPHVPYPELISLYELSAKSLRSRGRYDEAATLGIRVLETRRRISGTDHPDTLTSMANLASTYRNQGRWKDAEELDTQVMETSKRVLGEEHLDTLTSMANLASTYRNQGRWKDAEELNIQVMETSKRVLGEEHPDRLTSQCELARAYLANGQVREAVTLLEGVLQIQAQSLAVDHPDRLTSQHELARAYLANGQVREAVTLLEEVLQIQAQSLAADHPDRLTSQLVLASAYQANGQVREAVALLETVVKIQEQTQREDHPDRLTSQHNLASYLWELGQRQLAYDMMARVVSIRRQVLDESHPDRQGSESWLEKFKSGQLE